MGVLPLAAPTLFIFYFGMLCMVHPSQSAFCFLCKCRPLQAPTPWADRLAAFKFALAGFILPYMFIFLSLAIIDRQTYQRFY